MEPEAGIVTQVGALFLEFRQHPWLLHLLGGLNDPPRHQGEEHLHLGKSELAPGRMPWGNREALFYLGCDH